MVLKPLPTDIDPDDTKCSFCGVSYTIAHEVEQLNARIAELESALNSVDVTFLKGQLKDTQGLLDQERSTTARLRSTVDQLGRLNESMSASTQSAQKAAEDANDRLEEMKNKYVYIQSAFQKLDQVGPVVLRTKACLQSMRATLLTIPQLFSIISHVSEAMSSISQEYAANEATYRGMIDERDASIARFQERIEELETYLNASKDEKLNLQSQLDSAISRTVAMERKLNEETASMDADRQRLNSNVEDLGRRLDEQSRLTQNENQRRIEAERLVSEHQATIEQLRLEVRSITANQDVRMSEMSRAQSLLEEQAGLRETQLRTEVDSLKERLESTCSELGDLQRENLAKSEEIEGLKRGLQAARQETGDILIQLDAERRNTAKAVEEARQLETRVGSLQKDCSDYEKRLLEMRSEIQRLQTAARRAEEQLQEVTIREKAKVAELQKVRTEADREIQARSVSENSRKAAQEEIQTLKKQLQDLRREMSELQAVQVPNSGELQQELDDARAKIESLKRTVHSECTERRALMLQIRDLKEKLALAH